MGSPTVKPRYTEPCNHCGACCEAEVCDVGKLAFGRKAPCPGIVPADDGRRLCGLVMAEERSGLETLIRKHLGIGCGCSMPDEDTTDEEIEAFDLASRLKMFGR